MSTPNNSKNKRILILLLLTITISFINVGFHNRNFSNTTSSLDLPTEDEFLYNLKLSDYSSYYNNTGENMGILLHQSYLNNSFDIDLDLENTNNNSILIPCPTDTFFNSSSTEIKVENIYAPNKTLVVEDDSLGVGFENFIITNYYASFVPRGVGYIENISLLIKLINIGDPANLTIRLYDSENDGGNIRPLNNLGTIVALSNVTSDTYYWHKITGVHAFFNCSQTYNDTFFFRVGTIGGSVYWDWSNDVGVDGVDEMIALNAVESPLLFGVNPIDLPLKIDFAPLNNTPKPSEIGLKINSTHVSDDSGNSGNWLRENQEYSDSDGDLEFELTTDWWDVTCNIPRVQINYTKTDLTASSEFNITGSGQSVEWNVTRNGGLNYFDSRFNNYQINFTIPDTWDENTLKVFNGSIPKTSDSSNRSLGNGYREVNIQNAGNGTFWYLEANSNNLLNSIDTYIGSIAATVFNFSDIAHFNATFSENVADGTINLSIYSPELVNNELNYSTLVTSFTAGTEISLSDWDISDNVTQYGSFRIHVYWNNNTAAGFLEKKITILGETDLIPSLPGSTFDASDTFDIDIFFNDTGLDAGIDLADITYRIENGAIRNDDINLGNGNYRITIDCNDTDFSAYGPNSIEINASKSFYNNQSRTEQINILGETFLTGSTPKQLFNSTETFDIAIFYNDTVKDVGVDGGSIELYVNQTLYSPLAINDYLDGNYNITIDCDADEFDILNYGSVNITVNIEKSYYHNRTIEFIIDVIGNTDLEINKFPDPLTGYYNSDETFNITVYFKDVGRNEGINGGSLKVYVKEVSASSYQEYVTTPDPYGIGYYNITIDCSHALFSNYGKYNIKINVTKLNYYTAEDILEELVIGNTTLTILQPTGTISYVEGEIFEIEIEYMDHTQSIGIPGALISYTLNGTGYRSDNIIPGVPGRYNITIDTGDVDFGSNYGNVNIIIRANKTNYINLTRILTFERQILTQITPLNPPALIQVIRGNSVFHEFNYSDKLGTPIDTYDTFQNTSNLQSFQWSLVNEGSGNYTLELNTTNVPVIGTPYVINFSIYTFGKQAQGISFTILVTIIETDIEILSWNSNADFARSTRLNVSIDFFFNDTTNDNPITGLTSNDIEIRNFGTGAIWSPGFELFDLPGDGNYRLNISTINTISRAYTLQVNVSKFPNYNYSLEFISFYLRGNYTEFDLNSISDPGGSLTSSSSGHNYTIFEGSNIDLVYDVLDLEYGNDTVLNPALSNYVWYRNINTGDNGSLQYNYQYIFPDHHGRIVTSISGLVAGNYIINISTTIQNYENATFIFNLTIIERYDVRITSIDQPTDVDAGRTFNITLQADYNNGTVWLPLTGAVMTITPYFDGDPGSVITPFFENSSGIYIFNVPTRSDATNITLTVVIQIAYDHLGDTLNILNIQLNPISGGITLEDLMPYIIIIGAALAVAAGSVAVYRGVVVPKKREKSRILKEVKTIFDDAINLEHVLVLYKGTGTCIYFKSFGSDEIDPELISGFISAICSFGKDLVCQEELNEITYGDKMLLLSDGEYIRVALVLSKKASIILRRNLMDFIDEFEKEYGIELPGWRGQLNIFRDVGKLIDEVLSTSIILPHEITYEFSSVKALKNPHSKDVLKIASSLMKESERNFFFVATLLKEAAEKTHKDTAEIFMGIKELRDKKMLIPIELGVIEGQPISQPELNLINQKVTSLTNLTPEEKQKLVNDLSQLNPVEREAYFVSLSEQ
ncbi:MAG: hypothetical protein ACFFFB_10280, partial [Candidatus Heimdallarchaeota archaeon]